MNDDILYVWIYPEGLLRPVLCGKLELLNGRKCVFSYDEGWIEREGAFALSPDMPLQSGVMDPPAKLDIHPIFEDAGPDRWGKNIINKVFNPQRRSPLEYLELAGENRIGALGFSRSASEYLAMDGASFHVADLPELIRAANALSLQMPIDDNLRRLLRPGSSAGGARPKCIIKHRGEDWIAKFLADGDEHDVCAIEHASLELARRCGINAVESELVKVSNRDVLLVKRFDRHHEGRVHFSSARTLLIADGIAEGQMGYADVAAIARRLSSSPKEDSHELYRRMVLNILIENTDDHEKNQAFVFHQGEWKLSPAYDVLPQLQGLGFHQMRIGKDGNKSRIANALSECERFMLKPSEAKAVVEQMYEQVKSWRDVFANSGVPQRDIEACGSYVLRSAIFQFGKAPEKSQPAAGDRFYPGKIVAVDAQHVYQSQGRNVFVHHDRAKLKQLIFPEAVMEIQYVDGKVLVAEPQQEASHGIGR